MNSYTLTFLLLLSSMGCGSLQDMMKGSSEPKGKVVFQQEGVPAEKNSYIVAFKTPSKKTFRDFVNHRAHFLNYYNFLTDRFFYKKGVKTLDFMAAVDLSIDVETELSWVDVLNPTLELLSAKGMKKNEDSTVGLITEVKFEDEESAKRLLTLWSERGDIWYADPNYLNEHAYSQYKEILANTTHKYWLEKMNLDQAIAELASKYPSIPAEPVVAVMDSGVDYDHSYLATRMFKNDRVGLSDCKDDLYGCNTTVGQKDILGNGNVEPNNLQEDKTCVTESSGQCARDCCHGTHVAGIIAALDPNATNQEMIGVCPFCRIIAIRVVKSGKSGTIPDSAIIRGFIYVTRFQSDTGQAVRVVNASFGKFQYNRAVGAMIRALKNTGNGITVVAAAGNEDTMLRTYPAAYPDVIAVSNITESGEKHISSNFGPWVDVAANGEEIYSTVPGSNSFEPKDGTSMSAPVVAGLAGLLLSAEPGLSMGELRNRIIGTANATRLYNDVEINLSAYYPKIAGASVRVPLLGSGLVDALSAVKADYSGTIASANAIKRVDEGCGMIGLNTGRSVWAVILLSLPLVFLRKKL